MARSNCSISVSYTHLKVESPYHSTIAHGYLTLSVLPYLWQQIIEMCIRDRIQTDIEQFDRAIDQKQHEIEEAQASVERYKKRGTASFQG